MEENLLISGNYWLWFSITITWPQLQQFCKNMSSLHHYLNLNVKVSAFPNLFLSLLSCVLLVLLKRTLAIVLGLNGLPSVFADHIANVPPNVLDRCLICISLQIG